MLIQPAKRTESISEYYFSQKLREIDQMRASGIDVINLGIGSPDLAPSSSTIQALAESCQKPNNHGYQSYKGIPELRAAFSNWYINHFGVDLNPETEILPLIGSKEGIMHISMAFVNPGEEVLVPDPGYLTYTSATRLVGGKVRTYSLTEENGWLPDLDLLESEALENVKLMWVNYPHMPTGAKASTEFFEKLVDFGIRNNILICNDNPYSFILNDQHLSLLAARNSEKVCLELNSLSKSHNMAGWRVGMVAGNSDYIQAVLKVKSNMDSGMFKSLQLAAVKALSEPDSWYEEINRVYAERREIARDILETLNCTVNDDQVGLFLWARIPDSYKEAVELTDKLLYEAGVFVTPGIIFGKNGGKYVRISLCGPAETLLEAKNRIQKLQNSKI